MPPTTGVPMQDAEAYLDWLATDMRQAPATVEEAERRLRRWVTYGADLELVRSDKERGEEHVRRLAAHLGRTRTRDVMKRFLVDMNNISKWRGHGWMFKLPRVNESSVDLYNEDEVRKLRAYSSPDPVNTLRGRALVDVSLYLGLRRVEVSRMNASDIDLEKGVLRVLRPAKNGRKRDLPLSKALMAPRGPFQSWLRARPLPRDDPEAVWVTLQGRLRRLNRSKPGQQEGQEIGNLMHVIGRRCKVRANFVRGRHYCLQDLYNRTHDLYLLKLWAGWSDVNQAEVYVELQSRDLKARHDKMGR